MDKTTKRQILYKPGATVDTKKEDKKEKDIVEVEPPKPKSLQEKSEILYDWVGEHPLFNLNGVCVKIGVDRSNFMKGKAKGKELSEDVLSKFEKELKDYGFSL